MKVANDVKEGTNIGSAQPTLRIGGKRWNYKKIYMVVLYLHLIMENIIVVVPVLNAIIQKVPNNFDVLTFTKPMHTYNTNGYLDQKIITELLEVLWSDAKNDPKNIKNRLLLRVMIIH